MFFFAKWRLFSSKYLAILQCLQENTQDQISAQLELWNTVSDQEGNSLHAEGIIETWQYLLAKTRVACIEINHCGRGIKRRLYRKWWRNSSWAISNPKRWCCESAALHMPANLKNSAVATGREKVNFHSNLKERQCQRMFRLPHNCTHLTR